MTFLGSADPGGSAVRRSYSILRASSPLASRPCIGSLTLRMTATPPRNSRLWHPARGISFAPTPTSPVTPAHSPRITIDGSPGVGKHVTSSPSINTRNGSRGVATLPHEAPVKSSQSPPLYPSLQEATRAAGLDTSVEASEEIEEEDAEDADAEPEASEPDRTATDHPAPAVLEYKMVDDMFYAAKKAPPGSPESFWSYNQYRRTAEDGSVEKVKIHYCRSKHTMERVIKEYFMDEKVLGFDLEWMMDATRRDGVKKNVSLIQLASPSRIGLFQLALFPNSEDMVGPSFRALMENPDVFKVGVSIKADCQRLRTFLDIDSRGLMEISHLYKLVTYSRNRQYHLVNRRLVPLATQVEEYLHLPLFKGADVRTSNWARALDYDQTLYAASDAYAGLQLYLTLDHHRKQLDPCPPSPHRAELSLAIRLAEGVKVVRPKKTVKADKGTTKEEVVSDQLEKVTAVEAISAENKEVVSITTTLTNTRTSVTPKSKPTPTVSTPKAPEPPKDSRVEVAEDRVATYRNSHPETRSSFAQLRAYFLWHCYDLPPSTIAELLRTPPLKTLTVTQYIMAVVQAEKLPVDRDRLREVAGSIPQNTLWGRFPVVAEMVTTTDA